MINIQYETPLLSSRFGVAAGRTFLGALFLVSGLLKIGRFAGVASTLAALGLPISLAVTVLVIMVEVGGGLALALGWHARTAATTLMLFVVIATLMFHPFWAADAAAYGNQLNHFLKNVAILGALLTVACTATPGKRHRLIAYATSQSKLTEPPGRTVYGGMGSKRISMRSM
jgi:putative oxidoreductase